MSSKSSATKIPQTIPREHEHDSAWWQMRECDNVAHWKKATSFSTRVVLPRLPKHTRHSRHPRTCPIDARIADNTNFPFLYPKVAENSWGTRILTLSVEAIRLEERNPPNEKWQTAIFRPDANEEDYRNLFYRSPRSYSKTSGREDIPVFLVWWMFMGKTDVPATKTRMSSLPSKQTCLPLSPQLSSIIFYERSEF